LLKLVSALMASTTYPPLSTADLLQSCKLPPLAVTLMSTRCSANAECDGDLAATWPVCIVHIVMALYALCHPSSEIGSSSRREHIK
jgi:hypothetical protein